jgi:hypothetical protein
MRDIAPEKAQDQRHRLASGRCRRPRRKRTFDARDVVVETTPCHAVQMNADPEGEQEQTAVHPRSLCLLCDDDDETAINGEHRWKEQR